MKLRLLSFLLGAATLLCAQGPSSSETYLPNTVIVKVKEEFRASCSESGFSHPKLQRVFNTVGAEDIKKEFPNQKAPDKKQNELGIPLADLSLIYRLTYAGKEKVRDVASFLMGTGLFEYAEPFFLHQVLYNPNDPEIGSQYHLNTIQAYQAWDISKGDTNIVVGITDTGFEVAHPDLGPNVKYNFNDPIDGVDNDGDGYIDNYMGWDTGDNDNDPDWAGVNRHGVTVSGCAGAVTDNGSMVAAPAFNTRILPVKISNGSGLLTGSYNGIVYAADHGANIINCSWGSVNSWSQYGQDVITYAAINKNALVVCAAGNDNDEGIFYPASFDFCLSVAGTDAIDNKWINSATKGSNYNEHVDISAPGHNIYTVTSTNNGNTIGGRFGTSMSAPIVAGGAVLAWEQNPTFTGLQIGEILKATADSLEYIPGNGPYAGKLGEGRLNLFRSVTESGFPGLYAYNFSYAGNNQNRFAPGDTIEISPFLINFLTNSSAGTIAELRSKSPYIKMIDSVIPVGIVNTLGSYNFSTTPFRCVVLPGMPSNETVGFIFTATDGTYNSKRYSEYQFNIDYVDVNVNQIGTSVGASGKTGYNVLQSNAQGLGFTYQGSASILYQMGFAATDNSGKVSFVLDGDFQTEQDIEVTVPSVESDFDVKTIYNDSPASGTPLGITVKQKTLAWNNSQDEDYVIFEYTIINNSGASYPNFYPGFYADWDISNYLNNEANIDVASKTAYTFEPGGIYAGVHLLDATNLNHYAYNNDGSGGSDGIWDGFTEAEQISALTSGNARATASLGDVSQMIGSGPFNLAAGDSITFALAVLAGDNLADLLQNAAESDSTYDELRNVEATLTNSSNPNCAGICDGSITVSATGGVGNYTFLWDDPLSQTTATASGLCAGTYSCIITDSLGQKDTLSGIVLTDPAPLSVYLGSDTTLCSGASHILNASNPGASYLWSTGATGQTISVSGAGIYSVAVTGVGGCIGRDTIEIFTNSSPTVNLGNDTSFCAGGSILLDAGNPGLNFLWSSGGTNQTESFSSSGTIWARVTNFGGCSASDTLILTVGAALTVDLGPDQSNCTGSPVLLDAGNPGLTYLWSTGQTSRTISVNSSDTYFVTVTDAIGCSKSDTMVFTVESTPTVNLGPDTAVCRSAGFTLDAGNPGSQFLWSTGENTQTILPQLPGEYRVTVGTNCQAHDTVNISFKSDPLVWYNSGFQTAYNTNKGNVNLTFGRPVGGTYSGVGVSGNIFNTLTAGNGIHQIDYTYTDTVSGCAATTWLVLDVNPSVQTLNLEAGEISIFPNPFQHQIQVTFGSSIFLKNVSCLIFDSQGKLVRTEEFGDIQGSESFKIETNDLAKGAYHLALQNEVIYQDFPLIK